jgi:RimJ/RimL family protein N-acetyltransferase
MRIETDNLLLVLLSPQEILAEIEQLNPEDKAQVSSAWLARVRALREPDPWMCGFSILQRRSGDKIGMCGFKGPPSAEGLVEIAYGVEPGHQGRGYATEAAQALVSYAFGIESVRSVCAHTLRCANASTRVLTKCGFRQVGEVVDPEDGLVWRWELERAAQEQ